LLADYHAVHQHSSHSDQYFIADGASVKNGTMTNRHVMPHHTRVFIGDVAHAVVLDICVMTDHHTIDVTTQYAPEPYTGLLADFRIADDARRVSNVHARADLRMFAAITKNVAHLRILAMHVAKCKADLARFRSNHMAKSKPTPPQWIIVRMGDDMNWWLQETSADIFWGDGGRGVLDPRQVAHVAETLEGYRPFGFQRHVLNDAFQLFELESEIDDERLRLAPLNQDEFEAGGGQIFALPVIENDESGAYYDFLDAISAARIRQLNATHEYIHDCTEAEMIEELDALDRDRYFTSESIHCFDEINEILEWSPAEWDEPGS